MQYLNRHKDGNDGMSLLEMVVAMMMLVMFTGVVVAVLEITARFSGEFQGDITKSNGVLIDHQEIQIAFDSLVDVLSQPGLSKARLEGNVPGKVRIAYAFTSDPAQSCAPAGSNPLAFWGLSGPELHFPSSYRICLWQTGLAESSMDSLVSSDWPNNSAKPGIYVLQALPERADAATLPTRRVFCRPRPFC